MLTCTNVNKSKSMIGKRVFEADPGSPTGFTTHHPRIPCHNLDTESHDTHPMEGCAAAPSGNPPDLRDLKKDLIRCNINCSKIVDNSTCNFYETLATLAKHSAALEKVVTWGYVDEGEQVVFLISNTEVDKLFEFVVFMKGSLNNVMQTVVWIMKDCIDPPKSSCASLDSSSEFKNFERFSRVIQPMRQIVTLALRSISLPHTKKLIQDTDLTILHCRGGYYGVVGLVTIFAEKMIENQDEGNMIPHNLWETVILFMDVVIKCVGPINTGVFLPILLATPKNLLGPECSDILRKKFGSCMWYCSTETYDCKGWKDSLLENEIGDLYEYPLVRAVLTDFSNGGSGRRGPHRFCRLVIALRRTKQNWSYLFDTYRQIFCIMLDTVENDSKHSDLWSGLKKMIHEFDKLPDKVKKLDESVCAVCKKSVRELRIPNLMLCGGCNRVETGVCSKKCQVVFWNGNESTPGHNSTCIWLT